jgi:proteasome lid subunit RPN8/RPN11
MKIILSQIADNKIKHMIMAVPTEIGAMLSGYITAGGDVYVSDVYMTKQTVSGFDIDFDQESANIAVLKAMANDEMLIGWVHSHANMGVFWSDIDVDTINKLISFAGTFLCSIVGNRKMEFKGRIDYISTSAFGSRQETYDNLPIEVETIYPEDIKSAFQADIEQYVAKRVYAPKQRVDYKRQSSYWSGGRRYTMTDEELGIKNDQLTLADILDDNEDIGSISTLTDEEVINSMEEKVINDLVKYEGMTIDEAREAIKG